MEGCTPSSLEDARALQCGNQGRRTPAGKALLLRTVNSPLTWVGNGSSAGILVLEHPFTVVRSRGVADQGLGETRLIVRLRRRARADPRRPRRRLERADVARPDAVQRGVGVLGRLVRHRRTPGHRPRHRGLDSDVYVLETAAARAPLPRVFRVGRKPYRLVVGRPPIRRPLVRVAATARVRPGCQPPTPNSSSLRCASDVADIQDLYGHTRPETTMICAPPELEKHRAALERTRRDDGARTPFPAGRPAPDWCG